MLHTLHLQNFALVDDAVVELGGGFTVITGETGAGKSLILDALSLCIGGRASGEAVRAGAERAQITACFDDPPPAAIAWLKEQGIDGDGELIIRRQIEQRRSSAWVNGVRVGVAELKNLGALLVNIHSQHAILELLKPSFIAKWLDQMGRLQPLLRATQDAYAAWQDLQKQQDDSAAKQQQRIDRATLLRARLADIEPLLGVDVKAIEQEYDELSNIEELIGAAGKAAYFLDGDEATATALLGRALKLCEQYSDLSARFSQARDSLSDALTYVSEAYRDLDDYAQTQTLDPERLAKLNELMALMHRLSGRYRAPVDELIAASKDWQKELDALEDLVDPKNLADEIAKAKAAYMDAAKALHAGRLAIADDLCLALQEYAAKLSLPFARFAFAFEERAPSALGLYDVDLLFSANTGLPMQSLHKVASGGELSRIALIMQAMGAKNAAALPLLVFDEVDVGISGATAQVVGEMLRQLGLCQQIVAITHQAQVAACASTHLLVKKEQGDDVARSDFVALQGEARVLELARMSGGVRIGDETLAHAKSLLSDASDACDR